MVGMGDPATFGKLLCGIDGREVKEGDRMRIHPRGGEPFEVVVEGVRRNDDFSFTVQIAQLNVSPDVADLYYRIPRVVAHDEVDQHG